MCAECGEISDDIIPGTKLCRSCYNARNRIYQKRVVHTTEDNQKYYRRIAKEADERYAAWCKELSEVKTHTLTEEEWLEACKYFGGCALCNSESIDTRGYFIPFKEGGKYTACNVIPLCDKCATEFKLQPNPFRRLNPLINRNLAVSRGLSLAKLERAAQYLHDKIRGAQDEQQG